MARTALSLPGWLRRPTENLRNGWELGVETWNIDYWGLSENVYQVSARSEQLFVFFWSLGVAGRQWRSGLMLSGKAETWNMIYWGLSELGFQVSARSEQMFLFDPGQWPVAVAILVGVVGWGWNLEYSLLGPIWAWISSFRLIRAIFFLTPGSGGDFGCCCRMGLKLGMCLSLGLKFRFYIYIRPILMPTIVGITRPSTPSHGQGGLSCLPSRFVYLHPRRRACLNRTHMDETSRFAFIYRDCRYQGALDHLCLILILLHCLPNIKISKKSWLHCSFKNTYEFTLMVTDLTETSHCTAGRKTGFWGLDLRLGSDTATDTAANCQQSGLKHWKKNWY